MASSATPRSGAKRQRRGGGRNVSGGAEAVLARGGPIRPSRRRRRRPVAGRFDRPPSGTGGEAPRPRRHRRGSPARPPPRSGTRGRRPSAPVAPRRRPARPATGGDRTGGGSRTDRGGLCVWRGIGLLSSSGSESWREAFASRFERIRSSKTVRVGPSRRERGGALASAASRPPPRRGHAATVPRRAATGPRTRLRTLQRGANVGMGSRTVMDSTRWRGTDRAYVHRTTEPS